MKGFTLVEVLVALLILSTMALMSYRGLDAVLDAREQVSTETKKWQGLAAFLVRFEQDLYMAMPTAVHGQAENTFEPRLTFNRFATNEGVDAPRHIAYRLTEKQEIELWIWPGLDTAPGQIPARYAVLGGINTFALQYMTAEHLWVDAWPISDRDSGIPRAVKMHLVLVTGETLMRIISLKP